MKRIAKNFFSLFIGNIGSRILGFFVTIYLARILEVTGFGKLQFALAFFSYGLILTDPGLHLLGTREIAKDREKIREVLPAIVGLRFLLSLFTYIFILIFLLLFPIPKETKVLILLYFLSLFPLAFLLEWLFQGLEEMEYVGISRISVFLVYLPFVFLFVRSPQKIHWVPLFWLLGNMTASLLLFFVFWKRKGMNHLSLNPRHFLSLLRVSLPLGLAAIMVQIYLYFDTLLLGLLRGDEAVGLYNAAYKLVFFILLLDRVFLETLFPLVTRYYQESHENLKRLLGRYAKTIITLVLPIGVGGNLIASPIMNLVYGSPYEGGVIAFQILIWVVSISAINSVYVIGLIGCGREKQYTFAITLGTFVNIFLNLLMIPIFGIVGAAITTLFSEGIMFTLMVIQFEKIVKVQFWRFLPKPLLASILMGFFIYLMRDQHPIFLVFMGGESLPHPSPVAERD